MSASVPVRVGDTEIWVELAEGSGAQTASLKDQFSFEAVGEAIEAMASELGKIWQTVKPAEATVELGLSLTAKSGKLTALLVEGGGEASLKVTLTWKPK